MNDERTAEEWGRVAVALPGWRWMPGMRIQARWASIVVPWTVTFADTAVGVFRATAENGEEMEGSLDRLLPDLDDPATEGCLLALLGGDVWLTSGATSESGRLVMLSRPAVSPGSVGACWVVRSYDSDRLAHLTQVFLPEHLGRACNAAAEALGRWPGGAE